MIKIIQRGNLHRRVCFKCGCIFEFDEEDTMERYNIARGAIVKCIYCPDCSEINVLE